MKQVTVTLFIILELKGFSDISQSTVPYKHHISYDESFKKFDGGGLFD